MVACRRAAISRATSIWSRSAERRARSTPSAAAQGKLGLSARGAASSAWP